jgi:phosphoglucomutase
MLTRLAGIRTVLAVLTLTTGGYMTLVVFNNLTDFAQTVGAEWAAALCAGGVVRLPWRSGGNRERVTNPPPSRAPLERAAAGMCSVCGEESFGTGSDHIREKDGIWAVLAWLSILAYKNKDNLGGDKLVSVEDIVLQHWATYGRHYYTRYDYENVDAEAAKALMANLVKMQSSLTDVNKLIKEIQPNVSDVVSADEFEYKDPVDGSVSKHQGIRYLFGDGSRLVFRLSGTGSVGATIRIYIEQYENDSSKTGRESSDALSPLVDVALKLSKIQEYTGRSAPTVIT